MAKKQNKSDFGLNPLRENGGQDQRNDSNGAQQGMSDENNSRWSWITDALDQPLPKNTTDDIPETGKTNGQLDLETDIAVRSDPDFSEKSTNPIVERYRRRSVHTTKLAELIKPKNQFRATTLAILATLPSRQAFAQGTIVTRKGLMSARRKSSLVSFECRQAARQTRSTIDLRALEKKGLKLKYDDEEDYNEVERLKQIAIIKQMPLPISEKRKLRDKLFRHMPEAADSSCRAFCYMQKLARYRCKLACKTGWEDFRVHTTMWRSAFKSIEGHFGSGVVSYFLFLKALFMMNAVIFLAMFLFVVVPMISFPETDYSAALTGSVNTTDAVTLALNCSQKYVVDGTGVWYEYLINLLQGKGFLEKTIMFFGYYSDRELDISAIGFSYNLPFAYVTCVNFMLLFSLAAMVTLSARGFRDRLVSNEDSIKRYSNKLFAAWDYALEDETNAGIKHKSLLRDMQGSLALDRDKARRRQRTTRQICKTWTIRICVNLVVVGMLAGAGYLIYYTTIKTIELTESAGYASYHIIVQFLIQYMTSVTITVLNSLLPTFFRRLVKLEDYTPSIAVNVTLGRAVFLRLASLAVLVFSLYVSITCSTKDYCGVGEGECATMMCWETYVGQEFYKLVVTDFIVVFAIIFLVEFPRRLIVSKCSCKLAKMVGYQEFDISKNVLDLVYGQTLLWIGSVFSPMIPAITVVKNILVFYLKKVCLFSCYKPSLTPYKASDSQTFIFLLLIASFTTCMVPTHYILWHMTPSRGCGPFRIYNTMIDVIPVTIRSWPATLVSIIDVIWSSGVVICCIVALSLTIHYLSISIKAYKDVVSMVKEQLYLEGQDKHFLLARLQELTAVDEANKAQQKTSLSVVNEQGNKDKAKLMSRNATTLSNGVSYEDSPPNVPMG